MNLYTKRFNIIGSICPSRKIGQIKLNLVPSFIKSHRHRTNKWFYTGCRLIIAGSEPSSHIFVVQYLEFECLGYIHQSPCAKKCIDQTYLNFERKIFFQIFDNHDKEWQFDSKCFLRISWTSDVCCAHICTDYFQYQTLYIVVGNSLYMTISYFFIPNL